MLGFKKYIIKRVMLVFCIFATLGIAIGCSSGTVDNEKEENNNSSIVQKSQTEYEGQVANTETQEISKSDTIEFSDFLVERCVRKALGKDWDEDITYGEVKRIEELDICNTYDPTFAINNNVMGYIGYIDLADLRYFKNLEVLRVSANVANDSIVNVDAIANCTKLEELVLPCAISLQEETINLAGYKYWRDIFAKLPKLKTVDLGIYVDDNMKEIMLSETFNKEITFDKGKRTYDYETGVDYYFYKAGPRFNPYSSWFSTDASSYAEAWDYDYKSISTIINKSLPTINCDGWMFPAIMADDESSLKEQIYDIDRDIEDLVIVISNFEFDFELLERFDNLVTLTIINNDFQKNTEEVWDEELQLYVYEELGWNGIMPKNGNVLSEFNNLQVLNLSGFVGDLSFVSECDNLRELSIVNCAVDSTAFIGKMKCLKELVIRVFDNQYICYTEKFYEEVNDELMKLTGLKYLQDQNPNHSGEEYKDINEMKSLETLWIDEGGDDKNTVYNILQSRTIKNLGIADFATIFDGRFDKMERLENVNLRFYDDKVEKESIYSLVELDTLESIALGQINMSDGYFEEIYTGNLAREVVKNENISAFLIPMYKEYIEGIKQSIDKDFIEILYEAGVKESVYSYYYLQYNENLTIDEFLEWQ